MQLLTKASVVAFASGSVFWFTPGLGACGYTNTSDQFVASVAVGVFDGYPGATSNPNDNPSATRTDHNGTSVTVPIVDYCPGCSDTYVGFSPAAFEEFASTDVGIVNDVEWEIA
ncbi:uncharacterized protein B0H18DRAFT_954208 [Fomitopsis serialis]|uniref:uncharacterized protein n=1 Tax=Fomitopsis serialis TaxID=139415 RepID=UPI0020073CEE|nr:uncharacterized protein B0H18DRAFT_954208 [Neoantrodia serialis]KAH9927743.1 hypothetical protein B0H18DRAFT_954208 [Neoantrodia serialis]